MWVQGQVPKYLNALNQKDGEIQVLEGKERVDFLASLQPIHRDISDVGTKPKETPRMRDWRQSWDR